MVEIAHVRLRNVDERAHKIYHNVDSVMHKTYCKTAQVSKEMHSFLKKSRTVCENAEKTKKNRAENATNSHLFLPVKIHNSESYKSKEETEKGTAFLCL